MSLVFDKIENVPQTHILIIGIGGYPFLKDGTAVNPQQTKFLKSMGQLTCPPISAAAFYDMMIELHGGGFPGEEKWIKPLGSIELLVSNAPETKAVLPELQYENACWQNISNAYFRWKDRCETFEDNVAIFYYCGHGLGKVDQYLLAEDFGLNNRNPWQHAFNFDKTRRAFHGCSAKTQLFLIDACRVVDAEVIYNDITVPDFEPYSYLGSECFYNLTQKATAPNEAAFGKKNKVSVYTQAVINALKGQASSVINDNWYVGTSELASHIHILMSIANPKQGYNQRCINASGSGNYFVRYITPPETNLQLTCDPEDALEHATLSCLDPDTLKGPRRTPSPFPWDIKISAGIYRVAAEFTDGLFKNKVKLISVTPPLCNNILKCL